ncbi:MAG: SIS domain-containing protein [Omnitrophica bacterium]|nr:SIS domain-containing protein [Candidatus Omnitrophota bacterium]
MQHILKKSRDVLDYAGNYLEYVATLLKSVEREAIALFIDELEEARKRQNTVFFIGNGGSAVTATHMANDFGIGSHVKEDAYPYRALALTDNTAKITAISNDYGYNDAFVRQLKIHYRPGDKLVAISASGNSPNIIVACEWVKRKGGAVIGFTGFSGGKLKSLSDIAIHVRTPEGEYGPVEDVHMAVNHLVYMWLRHKEAGGDAL